LPAEAATIDLDRLLPAIVAGDSEAFGQWVAGAEFSLRAALHKFAALVDVEAVLQEALLRTWQVAPRFRADGKANGLLRLASSIARNLAIDMARRHRGDATLPEFDETFLGAEGPRGSDPFLRQALVECHERLPGKPKKALTERLAAAGCESDLVVAKRMKMQVNTFLQNITRARRLLTECLRKRGIDLSMELA
jgi:RNA polymerase sigma-70 factor (ECF subfamily)